MLVRFHPMAEIEGDGGGEGGGGVDAPAPAAPAAAPSFADSMNNVGAEAAAQLAANGLPPSGDPTALAGQPAPGAPAPAAAAPQFMTMEQGRALAGLYQQQAQQMQMMLQLATQRNQPAPAQVAQPAPAKSPSTMEMLADFREPRPNQGEDPAAFEQRRTAAMLDHLEGKRAEWYEKRADAVATQRLTAYQQQQAQAAAQQEGERQFRAALDETVTKGGFAAGTPAAQYVREVAENTLVAMANRGETRGWTDAHWRQAMTALVTRAKSFIIQQAVAAGTSTNTAAAAATASGAAPTGAAPAAAKPAAQATPKTRPPVGGAGGGEPRTPANGQPAPATDFEGAMRQAHGRALRETGQA